MKIEIRSPIRIDKAPEVLSLVETVKQATANDLKPKIKLARRVKQRMAEQLRATAKALMEEEEGK